MLRTLTYVFTAVIFVTILTTGANAQTCPGSPGCLDTTFGTSGMVSTVPPASNTSSPGGFTREMVFQSDGKIVILSEAHDAANTFSAALTRLTRDGSMDASFGSDGFAYITWGSPSECLPLALAVQTINGEDRFVVSGIKGCGSGTGSLMVQRYTSSGVLDTTFGTSGATTVKVGTSVQMSTAIQADQKILVGNGGNPMVRLNANGTPDTGFGPGGVSKSSPGISIKAMKALPDGKILAAGYVSAGKTNNFGVVRYTSDGRLDPTFGSRGLVSIDFAGKNDLAGDLTVDTSGKILVCGEATFTEGTTVGRGYDAVLVRLNSNGTLDSSFGSGGKTAPLNVGDLHDFFGSVSVQSDGKIILTGESKRAGNTANSDVLTARYNSNGTLDTSYSGIGWNLTDFYGANDDGVRGRLQFDPMCDCEKFVIVGRADTEQSSTTARYIVGLRFSL
jgi:uncharacterized delta-60 repeat protein